MDAQRLHEALLQPESYPGVSGPIGFRETHVSRIYFTPRHVYKVKKSVDFGFLNFTTLDRRRFYCNEEVRLNRRLCPDTYLGVVELRMQGDRLRVGGKGDIVDYAVHMKRLPEELMLERCLSPDYPALREQMGRVSRRISRFHREAEVDNGEGSDDLANVERNWRENFSQTRPFVGLTLTEEAFNLCFTYVERFLSANAPLLRQRQTDGWVRDGHGDLHAEHICLSDPVRIFDCIEFNRRFRVTDVAADLAFLLMDLEFRSRKDMADHLLSVYKENLAPGSGLDRVLPFYKLYRAYVRGKVDSFLAVDPNAAPETKTMAGQVARRYFNQALGYLCPVLLVATCGLMGTGKTTLAQALAPVLGAQLLRSDQLRKTLAGLPEHAPCSAPFGGGIYSPEFSAKTYDDLLQRTVSKLKTGGSVIADASFIKRADRDSFRMAAEAAGIPFVLIQADCPADTALSRLAFRRARERDASDGRPALFRKQEGAFEYPGEMEKAIHVDTTADVDYNVQLIICEILERAGTRS